MRFLVPYYLALSLTGCVPGETTGKDDVTASAAKEQELEGRYRVSFINGKKPMTGMEGHEPLLTITPGRIHFQSQCIFHDWQFNRNDEAIEIEPWVYEDGPPLMCARAYVGGEEAIILAMSAADTVRRVGSGFWFSGPDGEVEIERLPDPDELAAQAIDLSGYWRVAELDGAAIDGGYAITLKADHEQIWWEPACAGQSESYRITSNRFETISYDDGPTMVCDIGYPDALPRIFSALRAADTIARTPDNGVRISGKGRSVTLFSQ